MIKNRGKAYTICLCLETEDVGNPFKSKSNIALLHNWFNTILNVKKTSSRKQKYIYVY